MIAALVLLALQQPEQSPLRDWSDCLVSAATRSIAAMGVDVEPILANAMSTCRREQARVAAEFRRSPGGDEGERLNAQWMLTLSGAVRTRLEQWDELRTPAPLVSYDVDWTRCLIGAVAVGEVVPDIIYNRCQLQDGALSSAWRQADPNGAPFGLQRTRRDLHLMVDAMLSQLPSARPVPQAASLPQLDRSFMVGRWTDTGSCAAATMFNGDGRFQGSLSGAGTWTIQGNQLQLNYPDRRVLRMRLVVVDHDTLTVTQENGSSARSVRCEGRIGGSATGQPRGTSVTGQSNPRVSSGNARFDGAAATVLRRLEEMTFGRAIRARPESLSDRCVWRMEIADGPPETWTSATPRGHWTIDWRASATMARSEAANAIRWPNPPSTSDLTHSFAGPTDASEFLRAVNTVIVECAPQLVSGAQPSARQSGAGNRTAASGDTASLLGMTLSFSSAGATVVSIQSNEIRVRGIRETDIIIRAGGLPVRSEADLSAAIARARSHGAAVLLLMRDRNGGEAFIPVPTD